MKQKKGKQRDNPFAEKFQGLVNMCFHGSHGYIEFGGDVGMFLLFEEEFFKYLLSLGWHCFDRSIEHLHVLCLSRMIVQ